MEEKDHWIERVQRHDSPADRPEIPPDKMTMLPMIGSVALGAVGLWAMFESKGKAR